jgi:DNA-binding SARP family transcriptional activator/tetratricopeptide (TPR) repeat protein
MSYRGKRLDFPGGRARRLLVYLLLHPNGVERGRLAGLFWPESTEEQARTNLRRELHTLRKHLPAAETTLVVTKTSLCISPEASLFVDLEGDEEILPGHDEPWLNEVRQRLEAERVKKLEQTVAQAEERGDLKGALASLQPLLRMDSLREELHRHKIRLHLANGDRGAAMQAYQDCLTVLDEELGIGPSAPTRLLHEKLLEPDEVPHEPCQQASLELDPMLGREKEWAVVRSWFGAGAIESATPLLLVRGEPGIGKSRMLAELHREVLRRGGSLVAGRCYEAEQHRPFVPWEEAVSGFHELLLSGPEEANRALLFDRLVKHICRERSTPIVVMIDDLQWIDEASASFIHFAYRSRKMLVCCASRVAELEDNPHAQRLIRSLARERFVRRLELGPLGEEAILSLVPGVEPSRCGGNPLLALEVARASADGGQSIQELLESRLGALSGQSRDLISWAAALGSDFSAVRLRQVCGRSLLDLLSALEELEKHTLLKPRGEKYDFVHDVVREAVYSSLSSPRRQLLHLQIAQSLDGVAHPGEVAHHAVQAGESELAARACKDGCFQYLRVLAFHEAHQLAVLGIGQAGKLPQSWKVKVELFRGLLLSGIPEEEDSFWRGKLDELIEELNSNDQEDLTARATSLLTMWEFDRQDIDQVQERSYEAAELARLAKPREAAHMLAHSAACFAAIRRDIPKARVLLEEAAQLAEQCGVDVLEVHLTRGLLAKFEGNSEEAEEYLLHTLELAKKRRDLWRSIVALTHLAMVRLDMKRYDEVPKLCEDLSDVGSRLGPGSEAAIGQCLTALSNGCRKDCDAGLAELRKVDNRCMLSYCLRQASVRFRDPEYLHEACEAARGFDATELVLAEVALAEHFLRIGNLEPVRAILRSHRDMVEEGLSLEAREARLRLGRSWTKRNV